MANLNGRLTLRFATGTPAHVVAEQFLRQRARERVAARDRVVAALIVAMFAFLGWRVLTPPASAQPALHRPSVMQRTEISGAFAAMKAHEDAVRAAVACPTGPASCGD